HEERTSEFKDTSNKERSTEFDNDKKKAPNSITPTMKEKTEVPNDEMKVTSELKALAMKKSTEFDNDEEKSTELDNTNDERKNK
ncbi:10127_t:CDS:2, partial [Dentiscutata erythropus]